jgi:hypothetical protein
MQKFRVNTGEAQILHERLFKTVDSQWGTLVEREEHDISEGYDLNDQSKRLNLYRTLRALEGKDYTVKITRARLDTCNCTLTYIWTTEEDQNTRQHHMHKSEKVCGGHKHLEPHSKSHFDEVFGENKHKNISIAVVAAQLGVEEHEIEWELDHKNNRALVLSHPKLSDGQAAGRAEIALFNHPDTKNRPVRLKR